ncbi:MAG: hypothetical protein ACKVOR_06690 [Flavobacteriales bacterium]
MKQTLIAITAFAALSIAQVQTLGQAFANAGEYLDFLNKQSEPVTKDMWDYTSSVARSKGARKIENKRKDVVEQIAAAKKNVGARPSYKGQDYIKDAFINYLTLNRDILNDDYEKIVNMEEVAEQSYDLMEAYMMVQDQVNEKMHQTGDSLHAEVVKFAAENGITLTEGQSKTSEKLKRAALAFDYHDPLYLIFFKAFIQETNFLNALAIKDLAAADQAKSALLEAAEEGLEKLKAIKAFESDGSLKLATMDILKFYKKEATVDFASVLDFYTKQDTFNRVDEAMKKKKKSEMTKADTDEFNKAVNEYNAAVKAYNTTNSDLNTERGKQLNNWNKAKEDFLQKHAA